MPHLGIGEWTWNQPKGEQGWWCAPAGLAGGLDLRPLAEQAIAGTTHGQRGGRCLVSSPTPLDSSFVYLGQADAKCDQKMCDAFASGTGWQPQGDTLPRLIFDLLTRGSHPDGDLGIRPLIPTFGLMLEVHLPGAGTLWTERFQYGIHPHTAMVQAVVRSDYRAIVSDPHGPHAKFLGWLGQKYRIKAPQDVFIPTDLPKIVPQRPTTNYIDSFDRADSTSIGAAWTEIQNDLQISGNTLTKVTNSADCLARYDSDLSGSDMQGAVSTAQTGTDSGLVGAMTRKDGTSTVTCYVGFADWANDRGEFSKIVAGTRTSLGTGGAYTLAANSSGPSVRCNTVGSTCHTAFDTLNQVLLTDTSVTSGLRAGVLVRGTASAVPKAVDWNSNDVSLGGGGGSGAASGAGGILVENTVLLNSVVVS